MMAHALDVIPEGIKVIIISRTEPPPGLMRLRVNKKMHLVGWSDVRFTYEEAEGFISSHSKKELPREVLQEVYRQADGWAAGMLLMAENASKGLAALSGGHHRGMEEIFKYFAGEVLEKVDEAARRFLIKTAFLKEITPADAERLTDTDDAVEILDGLRRKNFFVERHGEAYRYHPLFSEFLLNEAFERFSKAELSAIRRDAAGALFDSGRYEDAASLFRDAGEWDGLTKIILSNAPSFISYGRFKTVGEWLSWLPEGTIEKAPWLLYWAGVCRLGFDPVGARGLFEKAYLLFKKKGDISSQIIVWPYIVDTFVYESKDYKPLDRWIDEMECLAADLPEFPSKDTEMRFVSGMLSALLSIRPHHTDLPKWVKRGRSLVISGKNVHSSMLLANQLLQYYLYFRDFQKGGFIIDAFSRAVAEGKCEPLTRLIWHAMMARYRCYEADWEGCKKNIDEGLKIAEENGIHIFDTFFLGSGAFGGMSLGETAAAEAYIEKMDYMKAMRNGDRSFYHLNKAVLAWLKGDMRQAVEHAEISVKIAEELGWTGAFILCLIVEAVVYFDAGRTDEAEEVMDRTMGLCCGMQGVEFGAAMYHARFAFDRGREEEGLKRLRHALAIGADSGLMNFLMWKDEHMACLCAKALEHGIETGYVKKLITKRKLSQPDAGVADEWPYAIKIYTLGGLEIVKDGIPLIFSGKVQKKPLEMLKTIIDLGGKDVPDYKICDLLWPDVDGDMAQKSLSVTLTRLRALLGSNKAILLKSGRLSINTAYCRVYSTDKKI